MQRESAIREPLILGHKTYKDITDDVVGPIMGPAPLGWKIMITISSIIAIYGIGSILYLISTGIGVWGLNKTVGWAWVFCCYYGRGLPGNSHGKNLVGFLCLSSAKTVRFAMGKLQQPTSLGCIRNLNLFLSISCLLVCRSHTRLCNNSR